MDDHREFYKIRMTNAQEERRKILLNTQEKQREKILDCHRRILEEITLQHEASMYDNLPVHTYKRKSKEQQMGELRMDSEWFATPPNDREVNWVFTVCPSGRRCIVYARQGNTIAVTKKGKKLAEWSSPLPGGAPGTRKWNTAHTILDCIYVKEEQSFYVLDLLQWGETPMVDTEMLFRRFWLKSRLADELPEATTKNSHNRYPLIILNSYPAMNDIIVDILTKFPYFPRNSPKVDGILFYHTKAYYTKGTTPLVGWLKPFMISEVLGLQVAEQYEKEKPVDYQDYLHYTTKFDEEYQARLNRKKTKQKDVEMFDDSKTEEQSDDDDDDTGSNTRKLVEVEMVD